MNSFLIVFRCQMEREDFFRHQKNLNKLMNQIQKDFDWDVDGQLKNEFTYHSRDVHDVAVLPNGDLASGSDDMTIKVWNPLDGSLKRTITGHTGEINALVCHSNGNLISGSADETIKIWSIDGQLIKTLNGHSSDVMSLAVFANGDIASGSCDCSIKIWSMNGALKNTLKGHQGDINRLLVHPNGDLVSASDDSTIKIRSRCLAAEMENAFFDNTWAMFCLIRPFKSKKIIIKKKRKVAAL